MIKTLLTHNLSRKNLIALVVLAVAFISGVFIISASKNMYVLFPFVILFIPFIFLHQPKSYSVSYLNIGFIILFVAELASTLFSVYFLNSLSSLTRLLVVLFLYVLYVIITRQLKTKTLFAALFFVFSSILVVASVVSFFQYKSKLNAFGFFEFNNFKHLYVPLALLKSYTFTNIWASALLLFIPLNLIFLLNQKSKFVKIIIALSLFLNVFSLIISFSRGVYLSLFSFVFLFNILAVFQVKFKRLILYNAIFLIVLLAAVFLVKDSFLTTVSFSKTASQQRSTSGRMVLWKHALKMATDKPLFGYGQKNYRLARKNNPISGEDQQFYDKTNNTYIQLLIERGIFGFVSYLIFFALIVLLIIKNLRNKQLELKQKTELILLASGCLAFLVRDLTFSTFFDSDFIYFLVFYFLFNLHPFNVNIKTFQTSQIKQKLIFACVILLVAPVSFLNAKKFLLVKYNNRFVSSYFNNRTKESTKQINRALVISPSDIELNYNKALSLSTDHIRFNLHSSHKNFLFIKGIQADSLKKSILYFEKVREIKPLDENILQNLAWVYLALNQKEKAQFYFEKSLEPNPYNATFNVSLALFHLYYSNENQAGNYLRKALRYSPDILESVFFAEFKIKYPELAENIKLQAINELQNEINKNNNNILKARLARLVLNENPNKAEEILEDVRKTLPSLNRPWIYLAYLNSLKGNSKLAQEYFSKALFLNRADYLSNFYFARFLEHSGKENNAIIYYKRSLKLAQPAKIIPYKKNSGIPDLQVVLYSAVLTDLIYYTQPQVEAGRVFQFIANYYFNQNNKELNEYYQQLANKYENTFYRGNEKLL